MVIAVKPGTLGKVGEPAHVRPPDAGPGIRAPVARSQPVVAPGHPFYGRVPSRGRRAHSRRARNPIQFSDSASRCVNGRALINTRDPVRQRAQLLRRTRDNLVPETSMEMAITGRHVDVTDDIRELIERKVNSALKVFPNVIRHVHVILSLDTFLYQAEAVVELTTNKTITAQARDKELRNAIDTVEDKVNVQLRKIKERIEDHHRDMREEVRATR
jgi:ribosomal subunit interface protein